MSKIENEEEITLPTLLCKRCGHTWHPYRPYLPRVCPKCHSPYWNRDRVRPVIVTEISHKE